MKKITPKRHHGTDWEHYGCEVCGQIRMLPSNISKRMPWCYHGDASAYSWFPPEDDPDDTTPPTKMKLVDVIPREVS
jgi:hypothetical protein